MSASKESILDRAEVLRLALAINKAISIIAGVVPPEHTAEIDAALAKLQDLTQKMLDRLERDAQ